MYPISTHEEMFSTLANGESFSKLDLARAYKQKKVISSHPLLTVNTHLELLITSSLWQRAMAQVLQGIPGLFILLMIF